MTPEEERRNQQRLEQLESRVRLLALVLDAKLKSDEQAKDMGKYVNHWHLNQLEAIGEEYRENEE